MSMRQLIILAFSVEAIVETIKMIFFEREFIKGRIISLIVALILCFSFKVDIFPYLGIEGGISFVSIAFTAILSSRGGNFIHDLFRNLRELRVDKGR